MLPEVDPLQLRLFHSRPGEITQGAGMKGTLSTYVNSYLLDRMRRGELCAKSVKVQRHGLDSLTASFGNRPLTQFGESALERWMETTVHLAPATRRNMRTAVKLFCQWMARKGFIKKDPSVGMPKIRQPRTVVRVVSRDERDAIWNACENNRDRAMFALLYHLGLRCIEVSRLLVEDWDQREQVLTVTGKGGHQRTLPVLPGTAKILWTWLCELQRPNGPMFPSPYGGHLRSATVSDRFAYLMKSSGVKRHAFDGRGAHALRRTAATETLQASGDLRAVKDLLGHADWGSMKHYQAAADVRQIRGALEERFNPNPAA